MRSVGTRLQEARARKGFSLEDVIARTRINSKNLAAIEDDKVEFISSPFLYRSFVRQYAETVELDFQTISPAVELLAGQMRQPELPGQGEHQVVRVAPIQARPKRDWSWVAPAAVLLGVIASGSGGYTYVKYYNPSLFKTFDFQSFFARPSKPAKPVAKPSQPPPPAQEHDSDATVAVVPDLNDTASSANRSDVAPGDKIRLELAATERTWLSVSADGKTAYTGILEPAETKVLEGQDSARLRTGNAGGVNIIFNGKPIGSIGPRGKTRTVVFSKTGYEIESAEGATLTTSNHIGG